MIESLSEEYGDFFQVGMELRAMAGKPSLPSLDANLLPATLVDLVPYAAFWGIGDDGCRIEMFEQAPQRIWSDLKTLLAPHEADLLGWLSSPKALEICHTPEYIAFSGLLDALHWPRN